MGGLFTGAVPHSRYAAVANQVFDAGQHCPAFAAVYAGHPPAAPLQEALVLHAAPGAFAGNERFAAIQVIGRVCLFRRVAAALLWGQHFWVPVASMDRRGRKAGLPVDPSVACRASLLAFGYRRVKNVSIHKGKPQAVDLVTFVDGKFGQAGAVLVGNAGGWNLFLCRGCLGWCGRRLLRVRVLG
jgi:hypothetical protein